nr:hypothetical protein [Tanacetum cinerariifolium]
MQHLTQFYLHLKLKNLLSDHSAMEFPNLYEDVSSMVEETHGSLGRVCRNKRQNYDDNNDNDNDPDEKFKSKNLNAERKRREKLKNRMLELRSVVPKITNLNKETIVIDAIDYIQELKISVEDLTREIYAMEEEMANEQSFEIVQIRPEEKMKKWGIEMTTSSTNNSVFRGFFEKQKLTGSNFINWYLQLRIVLSIEDKLNYLEQPIPPASVVPTGQHVSPEILAAHTAWNKGSKEITLFAQQTEQELLQTTRDFRSCKQEEGQSVSSYVLKMKGYIDNLERLGHPVTLSLGVSLILIGLRKEFDGFVQNYNMHRLGKTINDLHAMLKLHEQTLPKNNTLALHVIRAGKVQKMNKHKKSQPQIAARGQNHRKGKNKQAYAPKPKIPSPPKREDPTKDSIYHECGETGHWKRNCPRAIPRDGIFEIDLSYSYTNESSIYVVSNKRAKLDLDSALLWHCYLRHISKKRIEKLQHYGLLDSTDLDLRDFEKCVSCMSEKMTRKPYAHQVERAKDLLGLIHTDDHGIIAHRTPPYTPQHNGVSERKNRTLLDMVQSMMSQTTLPKSLWDYALETTVRILNMVPTKKVEKTPYKQVALQKKTVMDGVVHTYKARLVAKGYTQTPMIDYEDTFSPVADITSIRILIAIDAYYDYEIWKMDVKTALHNGYLNKEVYMKQPEGFVNPKFPNRRYCMENSKRGSIPMKEKLKLSKSQGTSTPVEVKRMQNVSYACIRSFESIRTATALGGELVIATYQKDL